ncbi:MAG: phenylalanine--tRNA ligase subunit beta, partial [bacterium]|nr:phenylalanine--tRNA ligase subunit beta [bacterium]
ETGQPLHTFDADKLEGRKIIVRFARDRERIVILDEQKFELTSDILVIADEKRPVAIAGIKGGKLPEIDKKTKTVVIESANFDSHIVRRGSRNLNLRTDASVRFEHGIDPNLTEFAANRAAYLIQKMAGGRIAGGLVDFYPQKSLPKIVRLDLKYLERLLGEEIPRVKVKTIFKNLGFQIVKDEAQHLTLRVPTRRLDIFLPEDLIEEAGRIYGYEKIEPCYPLTSLILPEKNLNIFWENMVKNILKEAGFTEVYNYSFFSEKEAKLFGYLEGKELGDEDKSSSSSFANARLVEVENPLSQEQKYLRASLIPYLLKNAEKNLRNYKRLKIFEFGKIFRNFRKPEEKRMLTGLISGEDFYQLKGIVDLLLRSLGVANFWYDEHKSTPEESKLKIWHQKKSAEIKVDGQEIGFLGEISPRILNALEVKEKLVLFDID